MQVRVESNSRSIYRYLSMKTLNSVGVEKAANISIDFDPSYQTLTMHWVRIRRGEAVMDKLVPKSVKLLQRERELEYLIYDGTKTASLFLDDIRVGDIIEYAYTLTGSNPVFANQTFGRLDLQWSVPVQHLRARLLVPVGRTIQVTSLNTDMQAQVTESGAYREYRWTREKVAPLVVENDAPAWYDPYPAVYWTEFQRWSDVVRWAAPLYRAPDRVSPLLQQEIRRIADAHPDTAGRIVATLRFVQSQIRYLGVEVGPGSHAPSHPDVTFKRRFGDCKDKTLLMITMLKALGVEATPALVNTQLTRGIEKWPPMPSAFNHVLVAIKAADGSHYWLDPTRNTQLGNLARVYQPDFGRALLIDIDSADLVPMRGAGGNMSRQIKAELDASAGFDKPAHYTVVTVTEGAGADAMRHTLASQNREELQKQYLNYYARFYPDIAVREPFVVEEDESANLVTITERYTVPALWVRNEDKQRKEASIYAPDVLEYLRKPESLNRQSPLAVRYPASITHITTVTLPEAWPDRSDSDSIEHAAFTYSRTTLQRGPVLTITDKYQTKSDHVAADAVAAYAEKLGQARASTDYELYLNDPETETARSGGSGINWTIVLIGAMFTCLWVWLAHKFYRHDLPANRNPLPKQVARRFGGWLLLPLLGITVTPFRLLAEMSETLPAYAPDTWASLTQASSEAYHPMWEPAMLVTLVANLGLMVFSILLVVLTYQKRRTVPMLYIGLMSAGLVLMVLDVSAAYVVQGREALDSATMKGLARSAFGLLVWAPYFAISVRVAETFVHDYHRVKPVNVEPPMTPPAPSAKAAQEALAVSPVQAEQTDGATNAPSLEKV
ncbi:DUF3857 domain-containing protein [Chitinimonas sp. BJYL2]|uniref:DUF3857 domain-containing protein n=1 Tax=Chitinimonas sp. BJYL2 TaxID=2976696 RepID=UPI0022B436B4|nr:DUF3857 domain-containing protein [Chitinimonas sp. BJYL2]